MVMYNYTKNVIADKLQLEIVNEELTTIQYIETVADSVDIYFSEELSLEDKATLDAIVDAHDGNIPTIIPDVTPRQIRQALILSGVSLQQIDDAINSLSEPTKSLARVEWEYSNVFQRNRPLVAQVAAMLRWTDTQLDDLWRLAASL